MNITKEIIQDIINELEVKRSKQMNSYFKEFYTETIQMLKDKYLNQI